MSNKVGRWWRSVVLYVLLFEFSRVSSLIITLFVGTKSSVSFTVSIAFRSIIPDANQKREKKNSFCTVIVAGDLWWVVNVSIYYIIFLQAPSNFLWNNDPTDPSSRLWLCPSNVTIRQWESDTYTIFIFHHDIVPSGIGGRWDLTLDFCISITSNGICTERCSDKDDDLCPDKVTSVDG